jgi:hypothetical protein
MSETPPETMTFEELKAYAKEHFPETLAKLPPNSYYDVKLASCRGKDEVRLLVGDVATSTVRASTYLQSGNRFSRQ